MSSRQRRIWEWRSRRRGPDWVELWGRLLPVKEEVGDSDGEEEVDALDDPDPEFLDAEEIESGAIQIPSVSAQKTREAGRLARKALAYPLVLRYLPKLLPHKVKGLLQLDVDEHLDDDDPLTQGISKLKLPKIEEMLATEPWKLGFGPILYKELRLCGCEATWDNFLQCVDLLEKVPDLQLNALIVYNELKRRCMDLGDTYIDQSYLTKAVSRDMSAQDTWDAIQFLKEQEIVVTEKQRIFLYNYYWYEVNIADYIKKLVEKKAWKPEVDEDFIFGCDNTSKDDKVLVSCINQQEHVNGSGDGEASLKQLKMLMLDDDISTERPLSRNLDADQQRAVRMILANPVTIISGKGGCGKTTVVSLVFRKVMEKENSEVEEACKAFENDTDALEEWTHSSVTSSYDNSSSIHVLLTAPTGKAASLLKKKTELPAATLHQITCSYSAWKNQDENKEDPKGKKKPWKFSKVEALVVDEGSLVSVRIFSAVLKLLSHHAKLSKLVILGDVRQLPSIEPGNMLADVFASFENLNWAIELRTNHRAESQLIVDNATRISQQSSVHFDAVVHFNGKSVTEMPSEDKRCILVSLAHESDLSCAIKALLQNGPGLENDKQSQFIAFRRNDCLMINEFCCMHYSGHPIKDSRKRYDFRCKDKVCCTKNAYVKDLVTKLRNSSEGQDSTGTVCISQSALEDSRTQQNVSQSQVDLKDDERICNGEIFFITDDVQRGKIRELTLFDEEDRTYTLNYKALRIRSGLRHAWARTIHTFQGSEEDTVVYVLGSAGRQTWKHVYTAVTRGRKRVYIIAQGYQLENAIANKAPERRTRLRQRLKDRLHDCRVCQEAGTSSTTSVMNTQMADAGEHPVRLGVNEQSYTQLKSPPPFHCSPMSASEVTLPIPASNDLTPPRTVCGDADKPADYTILSTPDSSENNGARGQDVSPLQKRVGVPEVDMETPSKIHRHDICTNVAEASPTTLTGIQNLRINKSCTKQLFKPKK
ncbi:DNA helicase B isoform X2 [Hyperolius riggenbachi]|uniref:DNA helicase B isoform X2 n=1 Tax=Hyperolius riggenbachi TaxID=752182 RepID=UPI0035A35AD2